VSDMMRLRSKLRTVAPANSVEDAAQRLVHLLRDEVRDTTGQPACALARIYKTHPYAALDPQLKAFARTIDPTADRIDGLRCLVLLATEGDRPEWNSRHSSRGHQAIPLSSEEAVARAPMVLQLVRQLGLEVSTVVRPDQNALLGLADRTHDVFYVRTAAGSPFIPAQEEFVARYGIASVIGFGGLAGSGDLYVAILFTHTEITPESADLFKVIGLNFKLAMLQDSKKPLFNSDVPAAPGGTEESAL